MVAHKTFVCSLCTKYRLVSAVLLFIVICKNLLSVSCFSYDICNFSSLFLLDCLLGIV